MPVTSVPVDLTPKIKKEDDCQVGKLGGGRGEDNLLDREGNGIRGNRGPTPETYRLGMWLGLASVSMMFIGFSSAYILGRGSHTLWRSMTPPSFVWINTITLMMSSFTLELARKAIEPSKLKRWMTVTCLLGVVFLVCQLWVWRFLSNQGIYLSGNPHSSFFYLLTGVHGVHLLGGVIAMLYLTVGYWSGVSDGRGRTALDVTALYWHFMDGLWIYLLALLFFWR